MFLVKFKKKKIKVLKILKVRYYIIIELNIYIRILCKYFIKDVIFF